MVFKCKILTFAWKFCGDDVIAVEVSAVVTNCSPSIRTEPRGMMI